MKMQVNTVTITLLCLCLALANAASSPKRETNFEKVRNIKMQRILGTMNLPALGCAPVQDWEDHKQLEQVFTLLNRSFSTIADTVREEAVALEADAFDTAIGEKLYKEAVKCKRFLDRLNVLVAPLRALGEFAWRKSSECGGNRTFRTEDLSDYF